METLGSSEQVPDPRLDLHESSITLQSDKPEIQPKRQVEHAESTGRTASEVHELEKERINMIQTWYETYTKMVNFLTTISASLLLVSAAYILKDFIDKKEIHELVGSVLIRLLIPAWVFLLFASFMGIWARFSTYRWFAAALTAYFQKEFPKYEWDDFQYTTPADMKTWGKRSVVFGIVAGVALGVGSVLFTIAAITASFLMLKSGS